MNPRLLRAAVILGLLSAVSFARAQNGGDADSSFAPAINGSVSTIVVQSDGQILVGGTFLGASGTTVSNFARLNPDGSLDPAFKPAMVNGPVYSIAIQPADGKIVIGGSFAKVNGNTAPNVARFGMDGTFDTTFASKAGTDNAVRAVAILHNGQIAIGGDFKAVDGVAIPFVAYLNSDGTVDNTVPPSEPNDSVLALASLTDAQGVIMGGKFTKLGAATVASHIASLGADAAINTDFMSGTGANDVVNSVTSSFFGGYIITGLFTQYDGETAEGYTSVDEDGSGSSTSFILPNGEVDCAAFLVPQITDPTMGEDLQDFRLALGGAFNALEGSAVAANHLAQYASSGSTDPNFTVGAGTDLPVTCMAYQSDHKLLIGGTFTTYQGGAHKGLVRLFAEQPINASVDLAKIHRSQGQTATVTFTRNAVDPSEQLQINYAVTTALTGGVDYATLSGSKKMKAGHGTASAAIQPLTGGENGKITLTVLPGPGYCVGLQPAISVKIKN